MAFFIRFGLIVGFLFLLQLLPIVEHYVVDGWTSILAKMAATLIHLRDPDVIATGIQILLPAPLQVPHLDGMTTVTGISIVRGCNGLEAVIVLYGGILAYEARWRDKIWGLLLGFVAIQSMNLLRVITLFYLLQWHYDWFEFAHYYMWQALIMLDVLVFYLYWLHRINREPAQNTSADPMQPSDNSSSVTA